MNHGYCPHSASVDISGHTQGYIYKYIRSIVHCYKVGTVPNLNPLIQGLAFFHSSEKSRRPVPTQLRFTPASLRKYLQACSCGRLLSPGGLQELLMIWSHSLSSLCLSLSLSQLRPPINMEGYSCKTALRARCLGLLGLRLLRPSYPKGARSIAGSNHVYPPMLRTFWVSIISIFSFRALQS